MPAEPLRQEARSADTPTMDAHAALLEYYAAPGVFTGVEGFEDEVDAVPGDVAGMVRAVQGLVINHGMAPAYGVSLTEERIADKELHAATAMLGRAKELDPRPIFERREAGQRVAGVCRHFAVLFVAFARRKGVPARVRAGFANYFDKGKHAEHWVGEYWRADEERWVLVDAQIDGPQRAFYKPDFDTLDVPRDRFLVAGDAWRACREGAVDATTFGVAGTPMWGLVEVYGEVFQDLAALQKIELLPWGWYGLAKDEGGFESHVELVDRLAALSSAADAEAIDALRALVAEDERLRVPG